MKLYDSLTRSLTEIKKTKLNIYACGPTVYNYIHLGNARPNILADVLVRFFNFEGVEVNFLQNITDIDDKIIAKARESKKDESEIAQIYTQAFIEDLASLNIQKPQRLEPISKHLPAMIEFIQSLIDKGAAYNVDGDVYFVIDKWQDEYGKLSGRKIEELISGERVEIDQKKQNPLDFSLWKKTSVGKKWDSPFGLGRPGWHTECALLVQNSFNQQTIDLHLGGIDLKFPHHENERIQFLAQNDKELSAVWVHNGHLNINHEKMSKSVGNVVLVRDFVKKYDPNLLRWIFLTTNYKQPLDLTTDLISQGQKFLTKIENLRKRLIHASVLYETKIQIAPLDLIKEFKVAMNNDLNTAEVLSILEKGIKHLNHGLDQKAQFSCLKPIYEQIKLIFEVLGFFPVLDWKLSPEDWDIYHQWHQALQARDYQKADELRNKLQKRRLV